MPEPATLLPARRPELLIRPLGDEGRYVVKDPRSNEFFHLGEKEYFLLMRLDGEQTADEICAVFAAQFGERLSEGDVEEFIELAKGQGLLQPASGGRQPPDTARRQGADAPRSSARQSLVYWRK